VLVDAVLVDAQAAGRRDGRRCCDRVGVGCGGGGCSWGGGDEHGGGDDEAAAPVGGAGSARSDADLT